MRKLKLYTLAIIDGLILIAAVTALILGLIHSVSTSAEYLLLVLTPAPAAWLHFKINRLCDNLQEENGGGNMKK